NLACVRCGDFYEARLSSYVTIREDGDGSTRPLFRKQVDDPRRPLRCRMLANDYFNTYSFYVPACIPPGRYQLTLEIRDETSQPPRVAFSRSLPFVVAAEAASAE